MKHRKRKEGRGAPTVSGRRAGSADAEGHSKLAIPGPVSLWHDGRARFALLFAIIAACLLALYYFPRANESTIEHWTAEYLRLYTRMVAFAVGISDHRVSAHGNTVVGRFSMQVVKSCDAMEANILFASALLAFAGPWRRKAMALVVGLLALLAFNLVRLVTLYWVGASAPWAFEFLHYDVWPLFMVAFAALDFVVCVRWVLAAKAQPVTDGVEGHVSG